MRSTRLARTMLVTELPVCLRWELTEMSGRRLPLIRPTCRDQKLSARGAMSPLSFLRQRALVGPMLPIGICSVSAISA
jgi:hypothetical protein